MSRAFFEAVTTSAPRDTGSWSMPSSVLWFLKKITDFLCLFSLVVPVFFERFLSNERNLGCSRKELQRSLRVQKKSPVSHTKIDEEFRFTHKEIESRER